MHQVPIEIGEAEILQCLSQCRFDQLPRVRVSPQLRGDPQVAAADAIVIAGVPQRMTNLDLIAVQGGAVEVPVADADRFPHGVVDLTGL